jgi:hypothetical protein
MDLDCMGYPNHDCFGHRVYLRDIRIVQDDGCELRLHLYGKSKNNLIIDSLEKEECK